jgi:outer membrane protein assembly factor BamB
VNDLPQPDFGGKKYAYDAPTIASATPVIGGGLVAAKFANGDLVVLDLKTGTRKWGTNLGKALDQWGNSQSPLISGNLLIVPWEHKNKDGGIHAFDLASGEKKWTAKPNATAHWGSPNLATVNGQEAILVGGWGVTALNPTDGKEIWKSEPIKVVGAGMHSLSLTLLNQKHVLFCASKTPLMAFALDGKGEQKALWATSSDNMPDMASPVSDGVNTWIVSNRGMLTTYRNDDGQIEAGPVKILTDPKDIIYASPMLLGDHLLVLTLNGEAIMLDAKSLKVLDRKNLGDQLAATPAVVNDLLILRDGGSLRAIRLSAKGSTP